MRVVGRVQSLWRYPVKSMRGEELSQAFVGFTGVYGDRTYAFVSSAAPRSFPYLTGREQGQMLLYQPSYRHREQMLPPSKLVQAESMAPGVTPNYADSTGMMVDVQTPSGDVLPIDDPLLLRTLREGLPDRHELSLIWSHRAMTDCRPVSIFSLQTVQQLSQELGTLLDKRRFRANIYMELDSGQGFGEDDFVGRTVRIGEKTEVSVVDRDPRCKMITLDPDSGQPTPDIMRLVAKAHDGKAGIYGSVLVEGTIRPNDAISLLT